MQAVADRLGVKRSASNCHVAAREELLRLVARDAFRSAYEIDTPAVRWFGRQIASAVRASSGFGASSSKIAARRAAGAVSTFKIKWQPIRGR